MESVNEGKMHNDNCMPARSINMYDDFTLDYDFTLKFKLDYLVLYD